MCFGKYELSVGIEDGPAPNLQILEASSPCEHILAPPANPASIKVLSEGLNETRQFKTKRLSQSDRIK